MEIQHPATVPKFLDLLKDIFDEEANENRKYQETSELRHNPSSASFKKADGTVVGACLRQLYWRTNREAESDPKDISTKLQGIFGQAIHDSLLSKLQKSKYIRVTPEAKGRIAIDGLSQQISFRLDGLCSYHGDSGGLEIKTQQSIAVQRMIKGNGPKDKDLLQVISYFGTDPSLRWFALLYFGRDTAYRAEYHVTPGERSGEYKIRGIFPESPTRTIDDLSFAGIVSRWSELESAIRSNTIPARDFKAVLRHDGTVTPLRVKNGVEYKTDWTCKYCPYQTKCWSMEDAKEYAYKIPGDK